MQNCLFTLAQYRENVVCASILSQYFDSKKERFEWSTKRYVNVSSLLLLCLLMLFFLFCFDCNAKNEALNESYELQEIAIQNRSSGMSKYLRQFFRIIMI